MATSVFNQEVRQLVLDTRPITGGHNPTKTLDTPWTVGNEFGYANADMTSITFTGVNIRQVVGEEWYRKYNTFGLRLRQLQWDSGFNEYSISDIRDSHVCVAVRGFMWANHFPVFRSGGDTQYMLNLRYNAETESPKTWFADDNAPIFPFKIQGDFEDITVSYVRTGDYSTLPTFNDSDTFADSFPSQTFTFDIVPMQQPVPYELPTHVDQKPAKKLRYAA